MQRRQHAVDGIQVAHQRSHAGMPRVRAQLPRQLAGVVPLRSSAQLTAHEEQLLAGQRKHKRQQRAQVCQLHVGFSRQALQQRTLLVHHFIVRKRQQVVFLECKRKRKSQRMLRCSARAQRRAPVAQRIGHPAHVPLVVKAQAAARCRRADTLPRARLFCKSKHPRKLCMHGSIQLPQKFNRLQMFAAAMHIRPPCAGFPPVVQIQH